MEGARRRACRHNQAASITNQPGRLLSQHTVSKCGLIFAATWVMAHLLKDEAQRALCITGVLA